MEKVRVSTRLLTHKHTPALSTGGQNARTHTHTELTSVHKAKDDKMTDCSQLQPNGVSEKEKGELNREEENSCCFPLRKKTD